MVRDQIFMPGAGVRMIFRPEHRFLRVKGGFLEGSVAHKNDKVVLSFQHYDVNGRVVTTRNFRDDLPVEIAFYSKHLL